MGFFGIIKKIVFQPPAEQEGNANSLAAFVSPDSIDPDERSYYQPDSYYTFIAHQGSPFEFKVTTFEERKKTSHPSQNGLYVAEILLLDYCAEGQYPKPRAGYPGFWWFEYGIRDVGHALKSLEQRGFLRWAEKSYALTSLKVEDLKEILRAKELSTVGKKSELIERIIKEISEDEITIPGYVQKYKLTEKGRTELEQNGYVPYMHKHHEKTIENPIGNDTFNVWSINQLFPDGNASDWQNVVAKIEKKRFGYSAANAEKKEDQHTAPKRPAEQKEEIRKYLASKRSMIEKGISTESDGFLEEKKGLNYKQLNKDKEALVQFYISIGKNFNAPAVYSNAAILLRKYHMYDEELAVLDRAIINVPWEEEFVSRREKVLALIEKEKEITEQIKVP